MGRCTSKWIKIKSRFFFIFKRFFGKMYFIRYSKYLKEDEILVFMHTIYVNRSIVSKRK